MVGWDVVGGMVNCCGGLYWIGVVGGECDVMW